MNTAIKFGTAKNKVNASDRLIILLKFMAEPIIMNKQYIKHERNSWILSSCGFP